MSLKRICPKCQHPNHVNAFQCETCSHPLSANDLRNICDDELLRPQEAESDNENKTSPSESVQVKTDAPKPMPLLKNLCAKCGKAFPYTVEYCPECGSYLQPTMEAASPPALVLVSEDGLVRLSLREEREYIIGRGAELSPYLASKSYVGRRQASIVHQGVYYYIRNLGRNNPTLLNGTSIMDGRPRPLYENDRICLGGLEGQGIVDDAAYFVIRNEESIQEQ